ncbi:MAG: hypothetical protein AAB436_02125 [Patescibacteria group bacterium]
MDEQPATPASNPETNSAPPKEALASVPTSWPGAFGLYKYSRDAVRFNFWVVVSIWLAEVVVNAILRTLLKDAGDAIGYLVSALASVGYTLVFVASVRRQKVSFGDILSKSLSFWMKMIGLLILLTVTIILSLIPLLIPFFIIAPRLVLAMYFLIDQDMGVIESFKASWNTTHGYTLRILGIFGAALAMGLIAVSIIGIPFAIYFLIMYSGVFAVVYELLGKGQPKVAAAPEAATPAAPAV